MIPPAVFVYVTLKSEDGEVCVFQLTAQQWTLICQSPGAEVRVGQPVYFTGHLVDRCFHVRPSHQPPAFA